MTAVLWLYRSSGLVSAGHFDLESEFNVWTSEMSTPIQKTFSKMANINEVPAFWAEYVGRRGWRRCSAPVAPPP